jgi:nucleotide-binding universal stress UspA family protein
MAIRTILSLCTANTPDSEIKMVAGLCEETGAHLSLIVIGVSSYPPIGEYADTTFLVWAKERDSEVEALARRVASAKDILSAEGVSFNVESKYLLEANIDDEVALRAFFCDLVVLSNSIMINRIALQPVIEGAVFRSTRPVLIVPKDGHPTLKPDSIMIAWNTGEEAARAIYSAIGLMKNAANVTVLMVDPVASADESGEEPGADLAAYLVRHDVSVSVDVIHSEGRDQGELIKQHAAAVKAQMIVMGAYGHSRLRERIFGGVTEAIMKDPTLPVLMAH